MLKNLFRIWKEELFFLKREDYVKVISDLPLRFIRINENNLYLIQGITENKGEKALKNFKNQLKNGDLGLLVCIGDTPIAYGWAKFFKSRDFFFQISDSCCYLCKFYTHSNYRGHNVYPSLISTFIEYLSDYDRFYIDIEMGNLASKKGLLKVGFDTVKTFKFYRVFKITLNKYLLT